MGTTLARYLPDQGMACRASSTYTGHKCGQETRRVRAELGGRKLDSGLDPTTIAIAVALHALLVQESCCHFLERPLAHDLPLLIAENTADHGGHVHLCKGIVVQEIDQGCRWDPLIIVRNFFGGDWRGECLIPNPRNSCATHYGTLAVYPVL